MKIALAQINQIVGDFEGNSKRIETSLYEAKRLGADLCVFPEMAVTGYPPRGLLSQSKFVGDNLKFLDRLIQKTRDIAAIIGYVRPAPGSQGNKLQNVSALISRQEIVSTHAKTIFLSRDGFDEQLFFEPSQSVRAIDFLGVKLGICFFDDICGFDEPRKEQKQGRDVVFELVEQGAELIVAIGCQPFDCKKRTKRLSLLKEIALRHSRPIVFVNQIGGNDEQVLDGGSAAFGAGGEILAQAYNLEEDLVVVDIEKGVGVLRPPLDDDPIFQALVIGTRDYAGKCGFKSAILNLSGDLESSVTAVVAAEALGPKNVFGVVMPCEGMSEHIIDETLRLASNLNINFQIVEIDALFKKYLADIGPLLGDSLQETERSNVLTRIKAMILVSLANRFKHLLISTLNRTQLYTGKTTICGDLAGGLAVLLDVSRTLVECIACGINRSISIIPESLVERCKEERLLPSSVDGYILPPYVVVDPILERLLDYNLSPQAVITEGFEEHAVMDVVRLMGISEQKKRQAPPRIKITMRPKGALQVPIGHHFKY